MRRSRRRCSIATSAPSKARSACSRAACSSARRLGRRRAACSSTRALRSGSRTMAPAEEASAAASPITEDAFLGGRLRLLQPRSAYRAGLDAVVLAAAADAKPGQRVIDVGAGVGTVGLCLAVRTGADVVLLEPEERLAALAQDNARRNGLADRVRVVCGRVGLGEPEAAALGLFPESFDHVLANPPYPDR